MKKFEVREYSDNILEQLKASDQLKDKLKKDVLSELKKNIEKNRWELSKEYRDETMKWHEKYIRNSYERGFKYRQIEYSEEDINKYLQEVEESLNENRNEDSKDMVLCEAVASNLSIVDSIVDEFINQLLDLNVEKIDGISTAKATYNLRLVNGFIPNEGASARIKNFSSYSGNYNSIVINIFKRAKQEAKQDLIEKYSNVDEEKADSNEYVEKIVSLENEKARLLKRLSEIDVEIQDAKASCAAIMFQDSSERKKIK